MPICVVFISLCCLALVKVYEQTWAVYVLLCVCMVNSVLCIISEEGVCVCVRGGGGGGK